MSIARTLFGLLEHGNERKAHANGSSTVLTLSHLNAGEEYFVVDGDVDLPDELDELEVARVYEKPEQYSSE